MKSFLILILFLSSSILAGTTTVQKSIPTKVDSKQVILSDQLQVFDSLVRKVERLDSLLQKQSIQTVSTPKKENQFKDLTGLVKDWVNILFFLVAIFGTGATLWFNRKTLFNPLRTEVLKKQFETYSDILNTINDSKLCNHTEMILINLLWFASSKFGKYNQKVQMDEAYKKKSMQRCRDLDLEMQNLRTISGECDVDSYSYRSNSDNKFYLTRIKIDNKTLTNLEMLESMISNPFVASEIKLLIKKLLESLEITIKKTTAPLIEECINDFYGEEKNGKTLSIESGNKTIKVLKEDIIIPLTFGRAIRECKDLKLYHKNDIERLIEEISKQLKLKEVFKKSLIGNFKNKEKSSNIVVSK